MELTSRAERIVREFAPDAARRTGSPEVRSEHLLLGILDEGEGLGAWVLISRFGLSADAVFASMMQLTATKHSERHSLHSVLERSEAEATRLRHEYVSTEHILLGLVSNGDAFVEDLLERFGVTESGVRTELRPHIGG